LAPKSKIHAHLSKSTTLCPTLVEASKTRGRSWANNYQTVC